MEILLYTAARALATFLLLQVAALPILEATEMLLITIGRSCFSVSTRTGNFLLWQQTIAAGCSLTHSRGNRNVADNDRTLMFQCVHAHWQLSVVATDKLLQVAALPILEATEMLLITIGRSCFSVSTRTGN